jgi:hypothetical protein
MTPQPTELERRLRRSGLMVGIGLAAELISLLWNHPTSFFLFLGVGATLIGAGIIYYFYSLVTVHGPPSEAASPRTDLEEA